MVHYKLKVLKKTKEDIQINIKYSTESVDTPFLLSRYFQFSTHFSYLLNREAIKNCTKNVITSVLKSDFSKSRKNFGWKKWGLAEHLLFNRIKFSFSPAIPTQKRNVEISLPLSFYYFCFTLLIVSLIFRFQIKETFRSKIEFMWFFFFRCSFDRNLI
jgi:hypothetical protein